MTSQTEGAQRLFVGVDGGQTSTLTVLVNQAGEILSSALTGPCNHIHEPGGLERQYRTLREGYERVLAAAGQDSLQVDGVYLGLTGSGHLETVTSVYETDRLTLKTDTVTALAGAIPDMVGVIVIAGTGSTAHGRNLQGEDVTIGGHGFFIDDAGSGYDIARQGIRAVFRAADGRGAPTMLTELTLAFFGCETLRQMRDAVYGATMTRDRLARVSGLVGKAAAMGDRVALEILAGAGRELGWLVATALARLHMTGAPVPVAPIGGVFKAEELVIDPMLERIHQANPQAYIVAPRFIPAVGAALLAMRDGGVDIDEAVFVNLERTRSRLPVSATGQKII
ncbi:MAG: hypothetical protein JXN59_02340 [Anaerolineae bacterium]|nr:hypothetical protein [Anaerolineae bacterium]